MGNCLSFVGADEVETHRANSLIYCAQVSLASERIFVVDGNVFDILGNKISYIRFAALMTWLDTNRVPFQHHLRVNSLFALRRYSFSYRVCPSAPFSQGCI